MSGFLRSMYLVIIFSLVASAQEIIVKPNHASFLDERAANEFAVYAQKLLGRNIQIISDDQINENKLDAGNSYFIVGSPNINTLAKSLYDANCLPIFDRIPQHREGYIIYSCTTANKGHIVVFAGRESIGNLYAVYDYLGTICGVGFFQDGEYVPSLQSLPIENIKLIRQPRFDDRLHFVWNAHRALKKYFSFWWSLEEWEKEFDWMAKNRMNMMRMDITHFSRFAGDAFEQAFPEVGPEPEGLSYQKTGGWPSAWDWPPKYRTMLTQKILKYARDRGIRFIYTVPNQVPFRFKTKHPEYKYDPNSAYGESVTISPDDPHMIEVNAKHLAKIIELFGSDHLYLASPYAEADTGGGIDENFRLRTLASKKLLEMIKSVDPKGIWVFDTWDFVHHYNWWTTERTQKYFDSFDINDMYIYETAADLDTPPFYKKYNGFYGKKWAFGVLQAFAGNDALHGNPQELIVRIKDAANKPNCTGVFMIPELTHESIMLWDMVSCLAWNPDGVNFDNYLRDFVCRRYGASNVRAMYPAWQKIVEAVFQWGPDTGTEYPISRFRPNDSYYKWVAEGFGNTECFPLFSDREQFLKLDRHLPEARRQVALLSEALQIMLSQRDKNTGNPLYTEDIVTVYRSFVGKLFNLQSATAYYAFGNGNKSAFDKYRERSLAILKSLENVLSTCPSYSINKTIKEACTVPGHNKMIPEMIRQATLNADYTANDVYEQFPGYYIPRMEAYFSLLQKKLASGETLQVTVDEVKPQIKEIAEKYRKEGWTGPATMEGNAVTLVNKHFIEFAKWMSDFNEVSHIEAQYWRLEQGSGYCFRENFDGNIPNQKMWDVDNVLAKTAIISVKGSMKFTKPLWAERELVQVAVRMAKPIGTDKFPAVLTLAAGDRDEDMPRCEMLLQSNTKLYTRWRDKGNLQHTWIDISDADKWHVYAILPTKKGANFYVKEGLESFDPKKLPEPVFCVTTSQNLPSLFCYIIAGWEGKVGGNSIQVDWFQVGKQENTNTFDYAAKSEN